MRRLSIVVLVSVAALIAACDDSGQELAPTQPATSEAGATTMPPTTSTTVAPDTTVTTPPPTTTTSTTLPELQSLAYEEVASLELPIQLVPWIEAIDMVATKAGQVYLFEGAQLSQGPVLDISGQVRNDGEQGLLSIAVDPADTDRIFLHYSDNDGDTVVSEFSWDNESLIDEQVWLQVDQPAGNHNGGMLQFGPDGALYLGLGDGGGSNDTFGNGQNTDTLLGGLVRIDVNDPGADPQLFQYGLRNPWRFWIEDDLIYVADVGQNAFEEVSVVPFEPGVNHGWPITEGLHCFRPSSGCDTAGLALPVVEVAHGDGGTCSITGGIVYRGSAIPEIGGHFFYSDHCGGYLRSLRYEGGEVAEQTDWTDQVGATPDRVLSFGVDGDGEMYVLTTGGVLKIVAVR